MSPEVILISEGYTNVNEHVQRLIELLYADHIQQGEGNGTPSPAIQMKP